MPLPKKNKKSSKLYITFAGECLKILNNIKKSKKIPLKKETYFTKRLSKSKHFVYNKYNKTVNKQKVDYFCLNVSRLRL